MKTGKFELYSKDFQNVNCFIFTEYKGLNSEEMSELRKNMRSLKVKYRVVKNTLTSIIFKEKSLEKMIENLKGPTAVAILGSADDLVPVSKNLVLFAKDHKDFKIKSGFYLNKCLTIKDINEISNLPDKATLILKLIGTIKMPLNNIVSVLSAPQKKIVYIISQIKTK